MAKTGLALQLGCSAVIRNTINRLFLTPNFDYLPKCSVVLQYPLCTKVFFTWLYDTFSDQILATRLANCGQLSTDRLAAKRRFTDRLTWRLTEEVLVPRTADR